MVAGCVRQVVVLYRNVCMGIGLGGLNVGRFRQAVVLIELVAYSDSLVTLHTLVFIYMTFVVKPVHIFMVTSRASKTA